MELDALHANSTLVLTHLPSRRTTVGCKWLFKLEGKPDGLVEGYKAWLVVKGFSQKGL